MKILPLVSTLAAAACLALSVWLLVASGANEALQDQMQQKQDDLESRQREIETQQQQLGAQQDQINLATQLAKQVGPGVVRDLAALVLETDNVKVRALLEKHGIRVNESTAAAPSAPAVQALPPAPPAPSVPAAPPATPPTPAPAVPAPTIP